MANNPRFYGDDTKFGIGVVESVTDPLKAGRVRVRIYGIHSPNTDELPTTDLPWSQVMMPVTSASIAGEGDTPQLERGSQVFGMFLDGDSLQQFLVIGTMPGFSRKTTVQENSYPTELTENNTPQPARLVGESNAEKAYNFFIQYGGYTEDQAAGIVGGLASESGASLTTTGQGGMIKWSGQRLKSLKALASASNLDWKELSVQLAFILQELQGPYVSTAKKIVNTQQPGTAAEAFSEGYLGKKASKGAKTLANQAKAAFGSTAGGDAGPFTPSTINREKYDKGEIVESSEELLNILKSAKKKRKITELIIHDTDTYEDEQVTVHDIDKTHREFGGIQYHFLIQRNGSLQIGRDISLPESGISTTTVATNASAISESGKTFIKNAEGFSLTAYPDGANYAIGYGHNDASIEEGDTITQAQADAYFDEDIVGFEASLLAALNGTEINQNQFDAYMSLIFNIGATNFGTAANPSTTLKKFRQGKIDEAANAILNFNKETVNGVKVVNQGLTNRRNRERNLFLKPVSDDNKTSVTRFNNSVSVAMAGGRVGSVSQRGPEKAATYSQKQYDTLDLFIKNFLLVWRDCNILGHSDVDTKTGDPYFNVPSYAESKFVHKNKKDTSSSTSSAGSPTPSIPPILPDNQVKATSPTVSEDVQSTPSSTTPVTLSEAAEEVVTVTEADGTVTEVSRPGFFFDLSGYATLTMLGSYLTNINSEYLNDLLDVSDTLPTNGYVLTWNSSTNLWEPQAGGGGGGVFAFTDATVTSVGGDYLPLYDVSDSNNPKKTTIANLITDNAIATATSATAFTNKTGNISQWTNDSSYLTLAGLLAVDGAGSGLDADLLDGQSGAYYLAASSYTAADVLAKLLTVDGSGSGLDADLLDGQSGAYYLAASTYTAADVLAKLLTVDGSSSGLDADLLDGLSAAAFATAAQGALAASALQNVVEDITPQLGGSLDVNANKIVSTSNGNIDIEPHGTGNVLLGNYTFDADQTVGAGQDNYVLTYDNATGLITLEAAAGGGTFDFTDTTATSVGGDYLPFYDVSDANNPKKSTITSFITDNSLVLTSRSVSTATGLTGGGNLSADRTIALDINALGGTTAVVASDSLLVWDTSGSAHIKRTFTSLISDLGIWTSGNDGAGSGLDADTLDGKNTGTSGNVVPLLDGANTYSGSTASFTGANPTVSRTNANSPRWVATASDITGTAVFGWDTTALAQCGTTTAHNFRVLRNGSAIGLFTASGFDVTGAITATSNITAYSSDERLKSNIIAIPYALDKIMSIRGVEYDWNVDVCKEVNFIYALPHEHGVIAQEIVNVIPDAVAPAPFNNDYLTVRYERLVPLLIEAIKALKLEVDELKNCRCR